MRTFPIENADGALRAFEVEQAFLTRRSLRNLVASVQGVESVETPRAADGDREIRLRFECDGAIFEVWEPHGDNSRYWIGPAEEPTEDSSSLARLEEVFRRYQPPILLRVVGNLLSFRIRSQSQE